MRRAGLEAQRGRAQGLGEAPSQSGGAVSVGLVISVLHSLQRATSAPSSPTAPAQAGGGNAGGLLSGLPGPPPEPPQPPSCRRGTDGRIAFAARFGAFGFGVQGVSAFASGTMPLRAGARTLDQACEDAIAAGEAWLEWTTVEVTHPTDPERLFVAVLTDDLCIGEGFRVRCNMSGLGFRAICKRWGWLFPSERIMDAIDGQAAVRLPTRTWNKGPWPAVNGAQGVRSSAPAANPGTGSAMMANQSAALELVRAGNSASSAPNALSGLVSNAGKALVSAIGPRFRAGTNIQIYGWNTQQKPATGGPYTPNDPRWRKSAIVQSAGINEIHEARFVDYAQTARPVRRTALLMRGMVQQAVDLAAIYRSPTWSRLVRVGGGPLPLMLGEP